jgi:hypothetical protein
MIRQYNDRELGIRKTDDVVVVAVGAAPMRDCTCAATLDTELELLDQVVSTSKQRGRYCQPERLCRLKVDNELELCWLLRREDLQAWRP